MKSTFLMWPSLVLCFGTPVVWADAADVLEECIGYTIVGTETIVGYVDEDGAKDDSFEGCDFDRVIRFADGSSLTCNSFSYSYSYRPTAVLLAKSTESNGRKFLLMKMVVEDEVYDMEAVVTR